MVTRSSLAESRNALSQFVIQVYIGFAVVVTSLAGHVFLAVLHAVSGDIVFSRILPELRKQSLEV